MTNGSEVGAVKKKALGVLTLRNFRTRVRVRVRLLRIKKRAILVEDYHVENL